MKRLSINLPRNVLLTIYKSFIRPHLDYGDILYDNSNNENIQSKLEKLQYRACLAITGAIKGTSRERLYNELGLHSLITRRRRSKLIFFYKIVNGLLPEYRYSYLNFPSQDNYSLRSASTSVIKSIPSRIKSFKKTFFPYCINEWNKLNIEIRNARLLYIFKTSILSKKKRKLFIFCSSSTCYKTP